MNSYFFPLLNLCLWKDVPDIVKVPEGLFTIRRLTNKPFAEDYTALQEHYGKRRDDPLHVSPTLAEFWLGFATFEVEVKADSFSEALIKLERYVAALYLCGVGQTHIPYGSTFPVADWRGFAARAEPQIWGATPPELRGGLQPYDEGFQIFEAHPTFESRSRWSVFDVTLQQIRDSMAGAATLDQLEPSEPRVAVLRELLISSPGVNPVGMSFMLIWSTLEGLFHPQRLGREMLCLYIALLREPGFRRETYDKAWRSYGIRNKVAHGKILPSNVALEDWAEAWDVALDTFHAVALRGEFPNRQELFGQMSDELDRLDKPHQDG